MTEETPRFQYLRLPRDPLGARLGGLFWAGIALMSGWLFIGVISINQLPWLDYQNTSLNPQPLLNPEIILRPTHLSESYPWWMPPQSWLELGLWFTGRAYPLVLLILCGMTLRRSLHFYQHRHDISATSWLLRTGSMFILLLFSLSGFAVWNQLPLAQLINPNINVLAGGVLGHEYVSLLRVIFWDRSEWVLMVLVAGIWVGGLGVFGMGIIRLCEMIGLLIEFLHEQKFLKKRESMDRSLGQVVSHLREQTVSMDKLASADKSLKIVRQTIIAPSIISSQPQNLFGGGAELVAPAQSTSSPTASFSTINHSKSLPPSHSPSPQHHTILRSLRTSSNSSSSSNTTNTAAYKIISKPHASQTMNAKPIATPPASASETSINTPMEGGKSEINASSPPSPPSLSNTPQTDLSATSIFEATTVLPTNIPKTTLQPISPTLSPSQISSTPIVTLASNASSETPRNDFDFSLLLPTPTSPISTISPAEKIAQKPLPPSSKDIAFDLDEYIPTTPSISPLTTEVKLNDAMTPKHHYASWSHFPLPPINLLDTTPPVGEPPNDEVIRLVSGQIESALKSFGVAVEVKAAYPGPVITRYEIQLASGVKGSQIVNLSKDLARTLAVPSIRVVENIPGKPWMGLEVPNERRQMVKLAEVIGSAEFQNEDSPLTMAIGKDISGVPKSINLGKMPHLLVAGTTGSGKSVGLNDMILSMLYKATPNEVRMVMIDPKMVELSVYADIPHLISPVITDMKQAVGALNWCVQEMERREQLLSKLSVRNIAKFNQKVMEARDKGNPIPDPLEKERLEDMGAEDFTTVPMLTPLPYLVVIVDEFADLFMVIGKKIEEVIARLAQKGRAGGVHLILATQRPSVDVVTGLIKANVPSRIAFQVSSKIDSRTILDQQGAEALLGQGDMLYYRPGEVIQRFHGAFVSDDEVNAVADYLRGIAPPKYLVTAFEDPTEDNPKVGSGLTQGNAQNDYDMAIQVIMESSNPSISYLQRRMEIGFNKAAKFIEQMEKDGLLSAPQKNGKRTIIGSRQVD